MSKLGRVLVAMSGGVDSSVAAVLLQEEGYEVVGITMKTWDFAASGGRGGRQVGCCTLESMNDARAVGIRHGFPHFVLDIREEFAERVIDRFTADYMEGRTPNPCVLCNTHIKWAALLRRADALDCEWIATGHYARVWHDVHTGRTVLRRGVDRNKDQSYALWGVRQEHLARSLFPLGSHEKPEIRRMAGRIGLEHVADKPDSYEICFVPDNDYRRFLRERVPALGERVSRGEFVLSDGTPVGTHEGYPFYTIGQRHGLGLALGWPAYVTAIDPSTNTITIGPREELGRQTLTADGINLVRYGDLREEREAKGAVRYRDEGAPCRVRQTGEDVLEVTFREPRDAVTPGQAVVLYEGDDVLAGGWIRGVAY